MIYTVVTKQVVGGNDVFSLEKMTEVQGSAIKRAIELSKLGSVMVYIVWYNKEKEESGFFTSKGFTDGEPRYKAWNKKSLHSFKK